MGVCDGGRECDRVKWVRTDRWKDRAREREEREQEKDRGEREQEKDRGRDVLVSGGCVYSICVSYSVCEREILCL